jgi:hypothetical protein
MVRQPGVPRAPATDIADIEADVGELDVAVHDAVIVHMLNRLDDIPQNYSHWTARTNATTTTTTTLQIEGRRVLV